MPWDQPYGLAYDLTLLELCLRAKTTMTGVGLHCPDLHPPGDANAGSGTAASALPGDVLAGAHPSDVLAAEANFERYPAVLAHRFDAAGGAALVHVEQVPGGNTAPGGP